MYIKSNKLHVFPFGSTRKVEPTARIMNEQNISRLVRNLTDVEGFVIDYDKSTNIMEFMLHGYYFKVNLSDCLDDLSGKDIYAYIAVDVQNNYEYLLGGDTDGINTETSFTEFTGLYINQEPNISNASIYSLYILDKSGNVPSSSKSKFSSSSLSGGVSELEIDCIVCGSATELID